MTDHRDEPDATVIPLPGITVGREVAEYREPPAPAVRAQDPYPVVHVSVLDTPIIPGRRDMWDWLRRCYWSARLRLRTGAIHGSRSWLYYGRFIVHAPRGLTAIVARWWRWAWDFEGAAVRRSAATLIAAGMAKASDHNDAHGAHVRRIWSRMIPSGLLLVAGTVGLLWLRSAYGLAFWAALTLAPLALGILGARIKGRKVVQQVTTPTSVALTSGAVEAAFIKAGIVKTDDPARVVEVPRQVGDGWWTKVELPGGVTFDHVTRRRIALASAINCPRDCLHLDDLPEESERLLSLYVSRAHPARREAPEWPLARSGRVDVWQPVPIGWDDQGRIVVISLLWLHTLIGAAPQRGKTTALRLIALAVLLDPRVDLIIVDFKGGADWLPYRRWCLRFLHGTSAVAEFVALLVWLEDEYERRMAIIKRLRPPEGRVTPRMAADRRLNMRPLIIVVDELQVATAYTAGKRIREKMRDLGQLMAAAGMSFVVATQNPDKDVVPTGLRRVFLQRWAFSVDSRQGSEVILGTEAYAEGLNAAALGGVPGRSILWAQPPEGLLAGFKGRLTVANMTPGMADTVLDRVAEIREPAEIESGVEAEEDADAAPPPRPDVVTIALESWPRPQMYCHADVLAELMGWDDRTLRQAMREVGLPTETVRMVRPGETDNAPGRGYRRADLEAVTR